MFDKNLYVKNTIYNRGACLAALLFTMVSILHPAAAFFSWSQANTSAASRVEY